MSKLVVADIPLSVYVHWPWCVQKCPYCDFNSHVSRADDQQAYAQALLADWQQQLPLVLVPYPYPGNSLGREMLYVAITHQELEHLLFQPGLQAHEASSLLPKLSLFPKLLLGQLFLVLVGDTQHR
jgi:hypothetical protein